MTEQRGLDSFARVPLLFGPSPMHRLERLSVHLGGEVEIWAKREDCNSGLAHGGNKTRKLEYLVADALAQGCYTLVSIGGVQSNHTRQVAAVAAKLGLSCVLVQEHWVEWPDASHDKVGTRPSRGLTGYSRRSASRSAASMRRCSRRSTWRLGVRVVRHIPLGSKRMCANFETYASSGTPYCNP